MSSPSLCGLPDEILHWILCYGSAFTSTALEQTSSRFRNVTNEPLLWRSYCQSDYKFWDKRHAFWQKFTYPASTVDWKDLYKTRYLTDVTTTVLLNSILASQTDRIEKVRRIIGFGYDAKDTLLRHTSADSSKEDYLARRYYSRAILGCLHRALAIPEWQKLRKGRDVPLERALGVFDMFVVGTGPGDFDDVSARLDEIVSAISIDCPNLRSLSPRNRALSVAKYLRGNNLVGIEPGKEYYNVEHSFLGLALRAEGHNSLPLISAAIYCYIAQIFGLNAHPCGFPFHVHVIVRPEIGQDLDGKPLESGADGFPMFIDPFRSAEETPVSELQSQLNRLPVTLSHSSYLHESPMREIVFRCGKNILNSVLQTPHYRNASIDLADVKYAALWACMLFADGANFDNPLAGGPQHQVAQLPIGRYFPSLMEHFATNFPLDVHLIEQYIVPLFHGLPEYEHLLESVHVMKAGDQIPKQVRRRTAEHKNVKYEIGEVFRHRRYNYMAVVTGWDTECGAEEVWMEQMGVDRLQAGRHQSFYHVMVEDKSVRYVAEENIEIIKPDISLIPPTLVVLAGKYFKRFDSEKRRFVSNVRDEYPDD